MSIGISSRTSVQYGVRPPLLGSLSFSLAALETLALMPDAEDFDYFDKIVEPLATDLLLSKDYLLL